VPTKRLWEAMTEGEAAREARETKAERDDGRKPGRTMGRRQLEAFQGVMYSDEMESPRAE
jgi:hypothetical protein